MMMLMMMMAMMMMKMTMMMKMMMLMTAQDKGGDRLVAFSTPSTTHSHSFASQTP